METAIGNGCIAVSSVHRDGRIGLLLEQTCEPHEINTRVPDAMAQRGGKFYPGNNDVIIWIDNIAGARVLQDRLNMICLHLEGYEVNL